MLTHICKALKTIHIFVNPIHTQFSTITFLLIARGYQKYVH